MSEINTTFVFAPEYDSYVDEKEKIDLESVVIVEESGKEKFITQGKEYNFIPSGGKEGQVLTYAENGEVEWKDIIIENNNSSCPWESGSDFEESAVLKGLRNSVTGKGSVAEGAENSIESAYSHAEGYSNTIIDNSPHSHAEGYGNTISGSYYSHAEGYNNAIIDNSPHSHAEGYGNTISGSFYSHAEGWGNTIIDNSPNSHAEGSGNTISGNSKYSHVEGYGNRINNSYEHASGLSNISTKKSIDFGDSENTLFSVGNGSLNSSHNAFEIKQNGDIYIPDTNAAGEYYNKPMIKLQDKLKELEENSGGPEIQALTDDEIQEIYESIF